MFAIYSHIDVPSLNLINHRCHFRQKKITGRTYSSYVQANEKMAEKDKVRVFIFCGVPSNASVPQSLGISPQSLMSTAPQDCAEVTRLGQRSPACVGISERQLASVCHSYLKDTGNRRLCLFVPCSCSKPVLHFDRRSLDKIGNTQTLWQTLGLLA